MSTSTLGGSIDFGEREGFYRGRRIAGTTQYLTKHDTTIKYLVRALAPCVNEITVSVHFIVQVYETFRTTYRLLVPDSNCRHGTRQDRYRYGNG